MNHDLQQNATSSGSRKLCIVPTIERTAPYIAPCLYPGRMFSIFHHGAEAANDPTIAGRERNVTSDRWWARKKKEKRSRITILRRRCTKFSTDNDMNAEIEFS